MGELYAWMTMSRVCVCVYVCVRKESSRQIYNFVEMAQDF